MKTSYYVECNGEILGYYLSLHQAKQHLLEIYLRGARIVCLKGQYIFEGNHYYYLTYNGQKFKRVKRLI